MRKPTLCICENKGADQLRSNCATDQRLCFRHTYRTIPLLQPSSHRLSLYMYSTVCVGPVRKPQCLFSRGVAQIIGRGDHVLKGNPTAETETKQ